MLMKTDRIARGFVVGATANDLLSGRLWLLPNWKIEFFECIKTAKVFLSVLDSCFIGKSKLAANLSGALK